MYTIVSATNRKDSNTYKIAQLYQSLLQERGIDAKLFSLVGVNLLERDTDFVKIEEEILIPTDAFIFIAPEYNGSFPGALKMLIDTSRSNIIWWHKRALLTGISTGRAGNLRGLDHLTGVLNYLKVLVHHNKLPISVVDTLMDAQGNVKDVNTLNAINQQLDEFIKWNNYYTQH
ncbi:MAG: NAD(P)H-dependent oxidoreductase [Sphingobacteriales bacterium]|nr:NAD(P)H-dependent oxidoreductase [Sphingobacteriales bacterium]